MRRAKLESRFFKQTLGWTTVRPRHADAADRWSWLIAGACWQLGKAPDERQHIRLATDATCILGRGAVRDTYNLLVDGIVQVLRGLAELVRCELLEVAEELDCTRYVSGSNLRPGCGGLE